MSAISSNAHHSCSLADLATFDEHFYGDMAADDGQYQPELRRFDAGQASIQQVDDSGGDRRLTSKVVKICDPDMNRQLQVNIR